MVLSGLGIASSALGNMRSTVKAWLDGLNLAQYAEQSEVVVACFSYSGCPWKIAEKIYR
jgi:hypothetical protein